MANEPKRDWFKIWVHFCCGLVAGGFVGFYTFQDGWICILITALAAAILAPIYLDDFWESVSGRWW